MTSTEIQRLMTLYSQGKVPETYFREAISQYRESSFSTMDQSSLSAYYEELSKQTAEKARRFETELASKRQTLQDIAQEELDLYRKELEAGVLPWKQRNKLFSIVSRDSVEFENGIPKFKNITFRPTEEIVKTGTNRRGKQSRWATAASEFGIAELSYSDYLSRQQEAERRYNEQLALDMVAQASRFEAEKTNVLSTAESLLKPRTRTYTERSL